MIPTIKKEIVLSSKFNLLKFEFLHDANVAEMHFVLFWSSWNRRMVDNESR